MFNNLSLKGFTWPREPVLYLTLLVALANVAISAISGDVGWQDAFETAAIAIGGFIARGRVSPSS